MENWVELLLTTSASAAHRRTPAWPGRNSWINGLRFRNSRGPAAVFIMACLLQGCALSRPIDEQNVDQTVGRFASGDITLGGVRMFQSGVSEVKNKMRIYYANSDWEGLSRLVIKSDFGVDLYWYYLGRSAEGLGYKDAAKVYYHHALSTEIKCKDLHIVPEPPEKNQCDGIKFPKQVDERLARLQ